MTIASDVPLHFTFKIASRCNLDCSYCYVYNKGDQAWRKRPPLMSEETFHQAVARIRAHCLRAEQRFVRILFHGGEPCLVGPQRLSGWCNAIRAALQGIAEVDFCLQTNGTFLDERWVEVFRSHQITVGISIDGPQEVHDANRVDNKGRGSYNSVRRGVDTMLEAELPVSFLSVIQFGVDPLDVHRHLIGLGATSIDYLFPDFTHDTIRSVRQAYGATPCADFLVPIFDEWWFHGTMDVDVGPFREIARLVLGGRSQVDFLGNRPFRFLFIESDGCIEGLDVLKVCGEGISSTPLNVATDDFVRVAEVSEFHREAIFTGLPLPAGCVVCPERDTCAGGYLPHRYSLEKGFANPSVWCQDILRLFGHIRRRLEVPAEETVLRRRALSEIAVSTSAEAPAESTASIL